MCPQKIACNIAALTFITMDLLGGWSQLCLTKPIFHNIDLSLISLLFFLSPDRVWFSFLLFCPKLMSGKQIGVYLSHFALSWYCCVCLPNFLRHSEKILQMSPWGLWNSGGLLEDSMVKHPGLLGHHSMLECRAGRNLGRFSSPFTSSRQAKGRWGRM